MSILDDDHGDLEVVDLASRVDQSRRSRLVSPAERAVRKRRSRIAADGSVRRSPLLYAGGIVVILVLWAGVAAFSVLQIRSDVETAQALLDDARAEITGGQLESAAEGFAESAEILATVRPRSRSALIWPIRAIPGYRRTLDAVGSLGAASADVAVAAQVVTDGLAGEGGLGQLTPQDGRLPLETIAALSPLLAEAADAVDGALADVLEVTVRGVDPAVVDGRQQLLDVLAPAAEGLHTGAEMARVLPELFGADGPRRYLVLASNPTENRGTGGFFGAYTMMSADDGQLEFGPVGETLDLPLAEDGDIEWPDDSLEQRWASFGVVRSFRQMNLMPDFPAAAQIIEQYWANVMGEEIDGVIAVDPFAFRSMLSISGPVELEGFGMVGPEDVIEFVSYTAYQAIEDAALRKTLVGEVATATLQGFLNGPGDIAPGDVLDVLSDMVTRDSLLIHAVDAEAQGLLRDIGLSGALQIAEGQDLLAVKLNNQAGSKIDYFLRRSLRYDVELQGDGSVSAIVSAGLVNTAPTFGENQYMIGPNGSYEAGDNVSYLSVYCAPGCAFGEVPDATTFQGRQIPTTEPAEELGFGVVSSWLLLPAGRSAELVYTYQVPDGWSAKGADMVYRLRYEHQPAVDPTDVNVNVRIPRGFQVEEIPEGAEVVDRQVVLSVEAVHDFSADFRFSPLD